jgi:hypothetical protein
MINIHRCKFTKSQLEDIARGTKFEMEHTNSRAVARRIASQHECEFPLYYKKGLIPMEQRLRRR